MCIFYSLVCLLVPSHLSVYSFFLASMHLFVQDHLIVEGVLKDLLLECRRDHSSLSPSLSSSSTEEQRRQQVTEAADALVLYLLLHNRLLDAERVARGLGYTPEDERRKKEEGEILLSKDVCQLIAVRNSALPRVVSSASRYMRGDYSSLAPPPLHRAGRHYLGDDRVSGGNMEVEQEEGEGFSGTERRGEGHRSSLKDLDGTSSFEYILYA